MGINTFPIGYTLYKPKNVTPSLYYGEHYETAQPHYRQVAAGLPAGRGRYRLRHGRVARAGGGGPVPGELGELAETVKRMEAQVSSLKCDLAGQLSRADGGAGADHVLRDQLGMTNHQAKHLSRVAQQLEEMPITRAKLQAGEITLENATALTAAAGECGAAQVDQNRDLADLSPDANICGMIFGGVGRVLWLGRSWCLGKNAQRLAAAGSIYVL